MIKSSQFVDENLKTFPPLALRFGLLTPKFNPFVSDQSPLGLQLVARMVDLDIIKRYQLQVTQPK